MRHFYIRYNQKQNLNCTSFNWSNTDKFYSDHIHADYIEKIEPVLPKVIKCEYRVKWISRCECLISNRIILTYSIANVIILIVILILVMVAVIVILYVVVLI